MKNDDAIKWLIKPAVTSTEVSPIKAKELEAYNMAVEALSDRPHGEWVDEDGNKVPLDKDGYPLGSCWCNQCHEWLVGSDEYAIKGNFCPSCGAKMKNRG